jgi:GNAT superfamily N-acetyltransferase
MTAAFERQKDGFTVSCDSGRLDHGAVHAYLSGESYWAANRPFDVVKRSLDHSLCFGLYSGPRQIGLARVITDEATFAYLCDVYVLPEFQRQGLGKWLMECVMAHPALQGLKRFALRTADAHELYRKFGFDDVREPQKWMEIVRRPADAAAR